MSKLPTPKMNKPVKVWGSVTPEERLQFATLLMSDLHALETRKGSALKVTLSHNVDRTLIGTNIELPPSKRGRFITLRVGPAYEVDIMPINYNYRPEIKDLRAAAAEVLGFNLKGRHYHLNDDQKREALVKTIAFIAAHRGVMRAER